MLSVGTGTEKKAPFEWTVFKYHGIAVEPRTCSNQTFDSANPTNLSYYTGINGYTVADDLSKIAECGIRATAGG